MRAVACVLLAAGFLLFSERFAIRVTAQRLTGNLTGSGASCIPDAFAAGTGLGMGCADGEACCPTTNTCVRKTSCADFARICPPPTCGKDINFRTIDCPAEASKLFKSPKGLQCQSSSDSACFTNGTSMILTCTSSAGSLLTIRLMVLLVAAFAAMVAACMS